MKSESDNLVPISSTKAPITNLTLRIIKEYHDLVPHQSEQEYNELIHSLKVNGFWEHCPIVISEEGIILDGHHRWWACQELRIEPKVLVKSFNDKLQEKLFVIDSNLRGKRHLNIFQRIELALGSRPILLDIAKRNQSLGGKGVRIKTPLCRIDQEIGNRAGSGKDSVRKVELLKEQASQELLSKLRSGKKSIHSAYIEIVREQKQQEIITKAFSKAITSEANSGDRCELLNADFRSVEEIKDNSIDLILTDPPYAEEALPIYSDLAEFAYRTLVDGGSIVTYTIQSDILEIGNYMKNAGLAFCRIIPIILAGPFPRAYHKRIVITWKPLLWFTKGTRDVRAYDYMRDSIVIVSEPIGDRKDYHEWAQSPTEALEIISRLTFENQIVLDPMMGSGTTGIAALKLKRKFVGVENDPKSFAVAKAQMAKWLVKKL